MSKCTNLFFKETFDKKRIGILSKLIFFKKMGFYLAGGTALALQLGHRQSIDFDYFIGDDIDTLKLFKQIIAEFKDNKVVKTYEEKNTLYIEIDSIKFSFMTYKYELICPLLDSEYFSIASQEDIGAMKLWAIQNRATNKDYVDLYFILQKISLYKLLEIFDKKFAGVVNNNLILKSLIYFDDIIEEELMMNSDISFEKVKSGLKEIVGNQRFQNKK